VRYICLVHAHWPRFRRDVTRTEHVIDHVRLCRPPKLLVTCPQSLQRAFTVTPMATCRVRKLYSFQSKYRCLKFRYCDTDTFCRAETNVAKIILSIAEWQNVLLFLSIYCETMVSTAARLNPSEYINKKPEN